MDDNDDMQDIDDFDPSEFDVDDRTTLFKVSINICSLGRHILRNSGVEAKSVP